jgi:hypothetical protein
LKDRELGRKPKPNKPMLELVEMMFASSFGREIKKDAHDWKPCLLVLVIG